MIVEAPRLQLQPSPLRFSIEANAGGKGSVTVTVLPSVARLPMFETTIR